MQFFHFRLDEEISKDAESAFHQCKHKQDCLVSEGGWVGYKIRHYSKLWHSVAISGVTFSGRGCSVPPLKLRGACAFAEGGPDHGKRGVAPGHAVCPLGS